MADKIKFVDVSYLMRTIEQIKMRQQRTAFILRDLPVDISILEAEATDTMDILPYLELTRFQCNIIKDNITEIIRFADTGRV